jgi:hypothetical protein
VDKFAAATHNEVRMLYQHYKGGIYEFLHEATMEADLTPVVVYRALANGTVWVRPLSVFHEMIELDGRQVARFAPVAADAASSVPAV